MTFGQKLKQYRGQLNITQKELAEQMDVTFQTISKWESDINEPDFASVRKLAKIFHCTIEDLLSDEEPSSDGEESPEEPEITEHTEVEEAPEEVEAVAETSKEKTVIDTCRDCGSPIKEGEIVHHVERRTDGGMKEIVSICDPCFKKHAEEMNRRAQEIEDSMKPKPEKEKKGLLHKITDRNDKKPLIWSIILGIVAIIVGIAVSVWQHEALGLGLAIALPFLCGYCVLAEIYCIFSESYISDVFLTVASWSIKFPGLIWQLSFDGFMWLIAMKILFAIVGALVGIAVFLLALILSTALSAVSFIPVLIYNKTHY